MPDPNIDIGLSYLGGINKPRVNQLGYYARVSVDAEGRPNLEYVPFDYPDVPTGGYVNFQGEIDIRQDGDPRIFSTFSGNLQVTRVPNSVSGGWALADSDDLVLFSLSSPSGAGRFSIRQSVNEIRSIAGVDGDHSYQFIPQVEATTQTSDGVGQSKTINVVRPVDLPGDDGEHDYSVVLYAIGVLSGDGSKIRFYRRHDFHLDDATETMSEIDSQVESKGPVDNGAGDIAAGADASLVLNGASDGFDVSITGVAGKTIDWTVVAAWSRLKIKD